MHHGSHSPDMERISKTVIGWLTGPASGISAEQVAGWDDAAWEAARWAIQLHGIGPLLDRAIAGRPDASALHPRLRAYLADQRRLSGERVALLLQDLGELLEACHAAGIVALPLKGSLLATHYYAEPGLRPMNDLDVLIRPADEARMLELMARLGYKQINQTLKHLILARPANSGPVIAWDGEHPDNPRSIDLHLRIREYFWGISYDVTGDTWADSAPGDLIGVAAQLQRPAALLHHLAAHATSDLIGRRIRMLHLHDIALVAPQVDAAGWRRIVASARGQHEERYIYPALALTNRYYPVIPPAVLAELRAGIRPGLLRYLDQSSLEQVSFCNTAPASAAAMLRWFRPGREQMIAISQALLPKRGDLAWWYPHLTRPALLPLAYVRYGGALLGWLIRRALGMPRQKLVSLGDRNGTPEPRTESRTENREPRTDDRTKNKEQRTKV